MRPNFVDFHCHLDLYPGLAEAIAKCDERRTATLAVTTTPKAFPRNQSLIHGSEFVRAALGFHPQLVEERASELELFKRLLSETRYVGEVGLDAGPKHYHFLDQQKRVFHTILKLCAGAGDKIISVHSVRSAKLVLDVIEDSFPQKRGKIVLHWFTGSASEAQRAVELGCFFSVNEKMLSTSNGKRIAQIIPASRLLTETDGPFLKRANIPLEPGDVGRALGELARLKGAPIQSIQRQILINLSALLG